MNTNFNKTAYRFLFSYVGGYGHFHPLVPLARALAQAGHEVGFVAGATLRPYVKASGFAVFPIDIKYELDPEYRQVKAQLEKMPPNLETEKFIYTKLFSGITPRLRMSELVAIAKEWQPDMLIREAGDYAAAITAEYLGRPHAVVAFAAALKGMAVFERETATALAPTRQQWGLAPDPNLTELYRYLHLSYSPPGFALQAVGELVTPFNLPATSHFIRADLFDQSGQEKLPEWMAELPDKPIVYVTLGTEVNKEAQFYPRVLQTIISGLRELDINLIVTLGRDKDPADFGTQPPNVHIERYIPQSLLLPHCALMVMHGGSNSLLAALDVGLPVVIVPLIADQFFNAEATLEAQNGEVVQLDQLTPENMRAAVQKVLSNPLYRANSRHLQNEMHALPGIYYAVKLIEQILV